VALPQSSGRQIDPALLAALRPFATPIEVSDGLGATLALTMIKR
jgi:hypothetical protein